MEGIRCKYFTQDVSLFDGKTIYICEKLSENSYCSYPECDYYRENCAKEVETSVEVTPTAIVEGPRAQTITLCGSTRFKSEFIAMLETLTLAGWAVLLPGYYGHDSNFPITEETKQRLDELHKRKIDMSDAIYVMNINGYIGESTRGEIEYARAHNKEIIYFEDIEK